jgi:uncharacterized protein (TIGR02271 family)
MTEARQVAEMRGKTLIDSDGQRIGKIDDLYFDKHSDQVEFALVNTGMFGLKKSFVPLQGARHQDDHVAVPVSKAKVKDAPRIGAGEELSDDEERRLFDHYGMNAQASATTGTTHTDRSSSGHDAMTRSEEEMRVGTQTHEHGRARLRKYVVTEHEQHTVPVRHEEARIEREPITEANRERATHGPELTEAEHEVVLHQEEPVVDKTVTPKERVRMTTETHQDEKTVSGDVRKERIDAEHEGIGRIDR